MKWLSDKEYNRIYSQVPRVCVDIVIRSKKSVLLIKRKTDPYKYKYHLPGGRVKFRESLINAVRRIALSEIGVDVKIKKMIGYMEFMRERQINNKRHSVSIAFEVAPVKKLYIPPLPKSVHPIHLKFLKDKKLI